jgi:hypothetical protein
VFPIASRGCQRETKKRLVISVETLDQRVELDQVNNALKRMKFRMRFTSSASQEAFLGRIHRREELQGLIVGKCGHLLFRISFPIRGQIHRPLPLLLLVFLQTLDL